MVDYEHYNICSVANVYFTVSEVETSCSNNITDYTCVYLVTYKHNITWCLQCSSLHQLSFPFAWNRITALCKPDTDEHTESMPAMFYLLCIPISNVTVYTYYCPEHYIWRRGENVR